MASFSLTRIITKIVAIPGPLVTPKAAGKPAQSLPRCKRSDADRVSMRMIAIIGLAKPESALDSPQHIDSPAERA
jgi:hypothetical protein